MYAEWRNTDDIDQEGSFDNPGPEQEVVHRSAWVQDGGARRDHRHLQVKGSDTVERWPPAPAPLVLYLVQSAERSTTRCDPV